MTIELLRHGLTAYNAEQRYQGQRDIPLSAAGAAALRQVDDSPEVVYVTPLQRTAQTARILFPSARLVPIRELQEMCFGSFEGRNYREMEHDPAYLAWVSANCESRCPDGERRSDFCERVCRAFAALTDAALARGEQRLVIVAHGGTQMAVLERYVLPHRDYYEWCAPNGGGFVLDASDWPAQHTLRVIKTVQYTKENL
ncbi:MAG: histidine phosphatase family protein [Faecalibacterium sp.]